MQTPISISGISSISALGMSSAEAWQSYLGGKVLFSGIGSPENEQWCSKITAEGLRVLEELQTVHPNYKKLDPSVLLAILAAKQAFQSELFQEKSVGINIGSSRGATHLFESYHKQFLEEGTVSAFTSPTTTLGNISSWVGQELGVSGVQIGHSVTCSTALHALLNGIAWLQADMADAFVVGGSEAALTPFTLAQMRAMKLYSSSENTMACESMRFQKKKNTMVLGEAAAVAVLEKGVTSRTLALVSGYGFATERLEHNSSISEYADCFQQSMKQALEKAEIETVDAVILHAPGTVKGDLAEKHAIEAVFGRELPLLTSNKWMIGHTFAASGMLSVEMAVLMLQHNTFIENPFFNNARHLPKELKTILVNAVGFGGNAVSVIIRKN